MKPADHERSDISIRTVWLGVPAIMLGVLALAFLVLKLYPGGTVDRTLQLPLPAYPEPQLQPNPVTDMQAARAEQQAKLKNLPTPIDVAMRKVVADGIADWPSEPAGNPP